MGNVQNLRNNAKIAKTTFTPYGTIPKSVLAADENPIFHALWRRRIFFSPVKKSKVALWRNFYLTESSFLIGTKTKRYIVYY